MWLARHVQPKFQISSDFRKRTNIQENLKSPLNCKQPKKHVLTILTLECSLFSKIDYRMFKLKKLYRCKCSCERKCLKKLVDYPSELLYSEFKVFNIHQIYINILLKFVHKNRNKFKLYSHKYNIKRSDNICLAEPKFHITVAFNHSSNFGSRLYNKSNVPNMK